MVIFNTNPAPIQREVKKSQSKYGYTYLGKGIYKAVNKFLYVFCIFL